MHRRDFIGVLGLSTLAGVSGCGRKASPSNPVASGPDVDLVLTASPDERRLLPGEMTRVWRFKGNLLKGPADTLQTIPNSYLGPVIRLRRGQKVRIRFVNQLPEDSVVHWHGLDVPESADGHPRLAIGQGKESVIEFEVVNRAGVYWYHPHPHTRTGAQVYQGLAGLLLVGDKEEDALALPSGGAELICVLQDRRLDEQNQFVYAEGAGMMGMMAMMGGFLGDRILVNGQLPTTTEVDAGWHRVRLLNGSNARIYKLAWSHGAPITVVGSDAGLLEHPGNQNSLTLAPGQRADVLIDLSSLASGTEVHLESQAFPSADAGGGGMMGMMGMRGPMMGGATNAPNGMPLRLMTLRVGGRKGPAFRLPERLSTFDESWSLRNDAPIRRVALAFQQMSWLIGGRTFEMEGVAPEESVAPGSTHLWEFVNTGGAMGMQTAHPIHIHGRQFRVVSRSGGSATNSLRAGIADGGWMDTVLLLPGETVRVQTTFSRYPGIYLYHCHILEHEDMGMMRNFRIT